VAADPVTSALDSLLTFDGTGIEASWYLSGSRSAGTERADSDIDVVVVVDDSTTDEALRAWCLALAGHVRRVRMASLAGGLLSMPKVARRADAIRCLGHEALGYGAGLRFWLNGRLLRGPEIRHSDLPTVGRRETAAAAVLRWTMLLCYRLAQFHDSNSGTARLNARYAWRILQSVIYGDAGDLVHQPTALLTHPAVTARSGLQEFAIVVAAAPVENSLLAMSSRSWIVLVDAVSDLMTEPAWSTAIPPIDQRQAEAVFVVDPPIPWPTSWRQADSGAQHLQELSSIDTELRPVFRCFLTDLWRGHIESGDWARRVMSYHPYNQMNRIMETSIADCGKELENERLKFCRNLPQTTFALGQLHRQRGIPEGPDLAEMARRANDASGLYTLFDASAHHARTVLSGF
jgi:hypothetical protein